MLLTQAVDRGQIKGIYIHETDDQVTHGQFFDDTNRVVEARKECVGKTFDVFRMIGEASRLYIKYTGVKAVFISDLLAP